MKDKTNYHHTIKATDKSGKSCSFSVSNTKPDAITRPVIMYATKHGLIIDNTSTAVSISPTSTIAKELMYREYKTEKWLQQY